MKRILTAAAACAALANASLTLADHAEGGIASADTHAPIGVMADHFHKKGEWMMSYRFMSMPMEGNLLGSNNISPDEIATTIPNRFFGNPGQPPTLRIVPTEMTMDMHMLGLMYAPTDRITLMGMINYLSNDMDHTTHQGGMGTTVLGEFTTKTSGLGDSSLSALVSLHDAESAKIHAIVGVSVPTGDIEKRDDILTPTNMRPTVRVPYPMQLGSGSWDPIVGASYSGFGHRFGWGGQWTSKFRISDNDEDYQLGDEHRLTGWVSYSFVDSVSASFRLAYLDRGDISGMDPSIMGPVQTADPSRQGGTRLDAGIGLNIAGQGGLYGWRVALEYMLPVEQDLNGPQLETDSLLTLGIQKSW